MRTDERTGLVARAIRTVARWDNARRTRAALCRLPRAELWDIGLGEADLQMEVLTGRR